MPNRQMSVYVDGYNLYCGALEHTNRKWLDLVGLFRRIRSGDDLVRVRYFTSLDDPKADAARATRQAEYIRALETFAPLLSVHLGKRKKSGVVCGVAKNVCQVARKQRYFHKNEEKRTDVAIAAHMVFDVANFKCDQVVLVSGDSDFVPALALIREHYPNVRIAVYVPSKAGSRRPTKDLEACAHVSRELPELWLEKCQLPLAMNDSEGQPITCPAEWRVSATLLADDPNGNAPTTTLPTA